MPTLYLIRHGEPALAGVLLGRTDPPLSNSGRIQCQSNRVPVAIIYTSPLQRARESAEIMAAVNGAVPVVIMPELLEIDMGEWDGKAWAEIERDYPEKAAAKMADWEGVAPPNGEAWADFTARIEGALEKIRRGSLPAAVVSHLAVHACIAKQLRGDNPLGFKQDYAEVIGLDL